MSKLQNIRAETIVSHNAGLLKSEIDDEVVALNIESGVVYGLNKIGSRIWHLIAAPKCVSDICATLAKEYEIDDSTCEREVFDLLEELHREGLITAHEGGGPQPNGN